MKDHRLLAILLGVTSVGAWATPYYVGFEGDCMPEEMPGWQRSYSTQYGGAQRSVETDEQGNHYLVIDSLASQMIYDFAEMDRPINPTVSGERFFCEWRSLIAEHYGYRQSATGVAPDQRGTLAFGYDYDHLYSSREGWSISIEPGVFHDYRVESTDMVDYQLWIDGEPILSGYWDLNSLNQSFVTFGDGTSGGGSRSLVKWDYYRFGVVAGDAPETNDRLVRPEEDSDAAASFGRVTTSPRPYGRLIPEPGSAMLLVLICAGCRRRSGL
jgi:hypothetical protein